MNNYEIEKHLQRCFKYGPKCLRQSQIAGWVTSEVGRRKKAAIVKGTIADCAPANAPPDVITAFVAENTAPDSEGQQAEKRPQGKPPRAQIAAEKRAIAHAAQVLAVVRGDLCASTVSSSTGMERPTATACAACVDEDSEEDEYVVAEIINKRRGKGGRWEWEVRWEGWPADQTTWEPRANLHSAKATLEAFERKNMGLVDAPQGVLVEGRMVRADAEGNPDWLHIGHELLQKQVFRGNSNVVGTVTKFVTDPRKAGAQPVLFHVLYADGRSECTTYDSSSINMHGIRRCHCL